jgi:hypothetical protein
VEHKISLQFNLRWSIFLNISVAVDWIGTAAQAVHRRIKLQNRSGNVAPGLWYQVFAEIEEQFEVNLFQGLVQVLAVKQKKRRSEDMKKRIQAASQKRIVRSPPIFGLSLPLTACPGSSKSREVFGVYQNFRDLFGSSQGS